MDEKQIQNGIAYAEKNFLTYKGHLWLDKEFMKEKMNIEGKKILDFGCGMGGTSLWLFKNYKCIIDGIDIDENHIFIANKLKDKHFTGNNHLHFKKMDILIETLTEKYDYIISNDVFEHIPFNKLNPILKMLANALTEHGEIFLSYPPWHGPYASHLQTIIKLPWSQFLPKKFLNKLIVKRNINLVGVHDLKTEYYQLNHLTHKKLKPIYSQLGLKCGIYKSHSILNKLPFCKNINFNFSPFNYLVTKELLTLHH